MQTQAQYKASNLKKAKKRRLKKMAKEALKFIVSVLVLTAMLWFLVQMALKAFDAEWESRCPVWYEAGTQEFINCMQRD